LKKYIALVLSLLVFTLGANSIHNAFLLNDYLETNSSQKVDILIESGDTGIKIAEKLYKSGVIKASKVFYKLAINEKRSNSISPGIHEIDLKISAKAALDQLLDPKRNRGVFGFTEGLRKNEIFEMLKGFLFPAQYSFAPGTTTDMAVNQIVQRFNLAAETSKIDQGFNGFSPFELVTIASIIQAEGDPQDFTKIARVIYNRLEINMPLQMNATVDYATNRRGKIRLPYKQLEVNSRYNTYKYRGLPPGPIGNPGQEALNASVNREYGDWIYFITVKPQDTRFTSSFSQFNIWVNEFRKNEEAGLFK